MNINSNQGASVVIKVPLFNKYNPLVFSYFSILIGITFYIIFPIFVLKYEKTRGLYLVIRGALIITDAP